MEEVQTFLRIYESHVLPTEQITFIFLRFLYQVYASLYLFGFCSV
jgi:hypothetical protein